MPQSKQPKIASSTNWGGVDMNKRQWPEAADGSRFRRINPGLFSLLQAVKHFVYEGDKREMTQDSLITYSKRCGDASRAQVMAAFGILTTDNILVNKSGDGILKLNLSKLEDQIEIYNETL